MFLQVATFFLGCMCLFSGIKDESYFFAFCGLVILLTSMGLIYQIRTGKSIAQLFMENKH